MQLCLIQKCPQQPIDSHTADASLPPSSYKDYSNSALPSPKPKATKKSKKKKKTREAHKTEIENKHNTEKSKKKSGNTKQPASTTEDIGGEATPPDSPAINSSSTIGGNDNQEQSNFDVQSSDGEQEAGQSLDELDREVEEFRLRLEAAKSIPPGHTRRKVNFTSTNLEHMKNNGHKNLQQELY